jgi:MFS family permease
MWTFRSLNDLDRTEGTVTLVDAGHNLHLKDVKNSDVVLVPQPSNDPNDPLNWPVWKKVAAFSAVVWFSALDGWLTSGPSSAIPILVKEFHEDLNSITTGVVSWCILTLGLGVCPLFCRTYSKNFFWVPLGCYFGRRPCFIVSSGLFFGTILWSGGASSYGSLVASRVLNAFAGSASEGLCAAVVADLFFLHERGRWMSVYIFFLVNGTTFGTIVSGFIVTNLGWRWLFWVRSFDKVLIRLLQFWLELGFWDLYSCSQRHYIFEIMDKHRQRPVRSKVNKKRKM